MSTAMPETLPPSIARAIVELLRYSWPTGARRVLLSVGNDCPRISAWDIGSRFENDAVRFDDTSCVEPKLLWRPSIRPVRAADNPSQRQMERTMSPKPTNESTGNEHVFISRRS